MFQLFHTTDQTMPGDDRLSLDRIDASTRQNVTRRGLLQSAGITGIAWHSGKLAKLNAATSEAPQAVPREPIRSCILIFLNGGPSHIDTFDMKPEAPAEVRGEFQPISTSLVGYEICEHLPKTAQHMHRLTLIRSMQHRMRGHRSGVTNSLCGLPPPAGDVCVIAPEREQLPSYGSRLTWILKDQVIPMPHVALPYTIRDSGIDLPGQSAGFLGPRYQRFQVDKDPDAADFGVNSLKLPPEVSLKRLEQRKSLVSQIDKHLDDTTVRKPILQMDACYGQVFGLFETDGVSTALNIDSEPAAVRERYGRNIVGQSLLLSRRLVESGVRFVNVNIGDQQNAWYWDDHKNNFGGHKWKLTPFDAGFSALLDDLNDRGLLASTLVVTVGEFGRTPKINKDVGRDHWPDCYTAVLAGGSVREGFIYGASDRIGAYPDCDPVGPADLAATIFWRFGLDPATEIFDHTGRPFRIAEGTPIIEPFGD